MSRLLPIPHPRAVTRSESSLLSRTFASEALSTFSTFPRSGRTACRLRSRACLAEPPAESPSTMKSSRSSVPLAVQSLSFPGRLSLAAATFLRVTCCCAALLASLARPSSRSVEVMVEPVFDGWTHNRVKRRRHFRIVEAIFSLSLKLRVSYEDTEHSH